MRWVRRLALPLCIALPGALGVHAVLGFPAIGIDDANISFVYSRNLVLGHGLVFTPGYERVEGFSSLAWMLLCSVAFAGSAAPERALLVLSILLTALALGAALAIAERVQGARRAPDGGAEPPALLVRALCVGWCLALPEFYAWTTASLMETSLWSALLALAALALARDALAAPQPPRSSLGLGAVGVGLVLTRPEGMALGPALALLAAGVDRARGRALLPALRRQLPGALLVAAAMAGLTAFRLAYFGYPFPNPYYAKVSPDRLYTALEGARYVARFFAHQPLALLLALLAVAPVVRCARRALGADAPPVAPAEAALAAVGGFVLLGLALPLVAGGDHFRSFRFCQPFAPLLLAPLVLGLRAAWPRLRGARQRRAAALLAVALLGGAAIHAWASFARRDRLHFAFAQAEAGRRRGEALNALFADGPLPRVATVASGGLGFSYRGRVVDLMGLNWTAMGHSPGDRKGPRDHAAFDAAIFWQDPPELFGIRLVTQRPEDACGLFNLWESSILGYLHLTPRFQQSYAAALVETSDGFLAGYFLESWLPHSGLGPVSRFAWHCEGFLIEGRELRAEDLVPE